MKYFRFFLLCLFLINSSNGEATTSPPTRPRLDDLQKESSSFVGDPDPLDPLPVKNESLKEDEEPVLEDIRTVLNSKKKQKKTEAEIPAEVKSEVENGGASSAPDANPPPPEIVSEQVKPEPQVMEQAPVQEVPPEPQVPQQAQQQVSVPPEPQIVQPQPILQKKNVLLAGDEADLKYENKLYQINKKYNAEPTSDERWGNLTRERSFEVYGVEKGDTLEGISRTFFGDSYFWPKIWALNHRAISNPHQIYPGQKIYFYPANTTELPGVTVGAPASGSADENDEQVADEQQPTENMIAEEQKKLSLDGRDYASQNTVFGSMNMNNLKNKRFKGPVPQPIPDSLPIVRYKNYFIKDIETQMVVDLKELDRLDSVPRDTPYVLTAVSVKSDYIVPSDQINSLVCRANQFIPIVKKAHSEAKAGRYLLVDVLKNQSKRLKSTHVYKVIGQAEVNDKDQMRIKSCSSLMNSDTLIISQENLYNAPVPDEVTGASPTLVESLESPNQDFFNFGQLVVVGAGSEKTPAGQNFEIFSEAVGDAVGRLQIVKNMGTLSIGFLTGISQLIKINDQVVESSGTSAVRTESALDQELKPNQEDELILE